MFRCRELALLMLTCGESFGLICTVGAVDSEAVASTLTCFGSTYEVRES